MMLAWPGSDREASDVFTFCSDHKIDRGGGGALRFRGGPNPRYVFHGGRGLF